MLNGIEVRLNTNYFDSKEYYNSIANKIVYTGAIDEYFNYILGELEYRTLSFKTKVLPIENYQGNAVVNYTDNCDIEPYTRIIEHKHFNNDISDKTIITAEYPTEYQSGMEKYYTINDDRNNKLAEQYRNLANKEHNIIFGGRLAEYKYYDMDDVILSAMNKFNDDNKELIVCQQVDQSLK